MAKKILLWYRNDLRISDHEALHEAVTSGAEILPVYVDHPTDYSQYLPGNPEIPGFRRKFLLESLQNLDQQWRSWNTSLIVLPGKPEDVIPELCSKYSIDEVFLQAEAAHDESQQQRKLERNLSAIQVPWKYFFGASMIHPDDLPFDLHDLPDIFTQYRKRVEARLKIRDCFPTPTKVEVVPHQESEFVPQFPETQLDQRCALAFQGGETEAQKRLHSYLWESDSLRNYKETRNGLIGADYSSKFSAWLANGCLSARQVFHEVKKYEASRIANDSTYWLIFELLWRDYFRLVMEKFGTDLFSLEGITARKQKQPQGLDIVKFHKWIDGKTGNRFIDSNMIELKRTGFMSNRGRQNVASYFVHDLGMDWRLGAWYFEAVLLDYDVYSNWGNWAYVAGVGNDPRENRYFNTARQADMYDANGAYRKLWLD
jgi:deoxyribodipyrimidine photo-lyase